MENNVKNENLELMEQLMMEKIVDILHCCYDNVSEETDLETIYIFLWNEGDNLYVEYDYKIAGKIVDRLNANEYAKSMYETTIKELKHTLISLQEMCHEEGFDLPTAYKILYNQQEDVIDVDLEYDSLEPDGKWSGEYYLEWINNN